MTRVTTASDTINERLIDEDLAMAKMRCLKAKDYRLKTAYYKLWYAILVMKHKEEIR